MDEEEEDKGQCKQSLHQEIDISTDSLLITELRSCLELATDITWFMSNITQLFGK